MEWLKKHHLCWNTYCQSIHLLLFPHLSLSIDFGLQSNFCCNRWFQILSSYLPPPPPPLPSLTPCYIPLMCPCVCVFVDLVKHGVLTLVSDVQRYRNDCCYCLAECHHNNHTITLNSSFFSVTRLWTPSISRSERMPYPCGASWTNTATPHPPAPLRTPPPTLPTPHSPPPYPPIPRQYPPTHPWPLFDSASRWSCPKRCNRLLPRPIFQARANRPDTSQVTSFRISRGLSRGVGGGWEGGFLFEQGGVFFLLLQCCAFALLVCEAQRFECKNACFLSQRTSRWKEVMMVSWVMVMCVQQGFDKDLNYPPQLSPDM